MIHRLAGFDHALLGLHGHAGDGLDGDGHALHATHLLLGGQRDVLGQLGGLLRDVADVAQALAGLHRGAISRLDLLGAVLHRDHGFLRLGLDRLDQHDDVLGGLGRALGQLAHFLGHDGEAQAGFTGAGGLDGRVEREQVGLRRDLLDRVDDLRDLQRAIGQGLDLLRDALHLAADPLHADQTDLDRVTALLRGIEREASGAGRRLGVLGDLTHRERELLHRARHAHRLARLGLGARRHLVHGHDQVVGAARDLAGRLAHVLDERAELVHHDVDRVDDAAQDVGRHVATFAQVALRDLGGGVEEAGDVALEVLARAPLVVALGLGLHQRAEPDHGVVERVGELADFVAGGHRHQLGEIALTDALGDAHDLADRLADPAGEDHAGQHGDDGRAGEDEEQPLTGPGRGGFDDRPVHADPNGPELAGQDGHADVDDVALGARDRIGVLDVFDLLDRVAGHDVLLHEARRYQRRKRVGDEVPARVVDHDVLDAADGRELVDRALDGRGVAREEQVHRRRGQALGDGHALGGELLGHLLAQRLDRDVPGDGGQRHEGGEEEEDDLGQQSEADLSLAARRPRPVGRHAFTAADQSVTGTQRPFSTRVK